MSSPEFEKASFVRPNTELIRDLKSKLFIKQGSPLWWNTEHVSDPREFMPFDEFKKRLVHLGECKTTATRFLMTDKYTKDRDVYLYPEPEVPMTIVNLNFQGQELPMLVTARPYHPKELNSQPLSHYFFEHQTIADVRNHVKSGGVIDIPKHFYPHIRGLFAGKRGDNFFWYTLRYNTWWWEFGKFIDEDIKKKNLSFMELYEPSYSENRTYSDVWRELKERPDLVDQKKPAWVDFKASEVSADEFLQDYQKTEEDLKFYYPVRQEGIINTLPLVIATRTHKESSIRKPVVLGIYAENGLPGWSRIRGILRIKNSALALSISEKISKELEIPIDTVLFTPQRGRAKYERVSAN